MIINISYDSENFPEEKLAGLDEYIVRLSEAVMSGEYTSPRVTRALKDAYAEITFVTPDRIREVNSEQRNIDKETDCLSFRFLSLGKASLSPFLQAVILNMMMTAIRYSASAIS